MRFHLLLIASLSGVLLAASAAAAERTLGVTIYANDLALVQDKREIAVTSGQQRI